MISHTLSRITAPPSDRREVDRLVEEQRAPEHAEHGHDEDHGHAAGRAELGEQAEVEQVGDAGRAERERDEAGDVERVRAPRGAASSGISGSSTTAAASCWPIAIESGGSPAKRTRTRFAPTP